MSVGNVPGYKLGGKQKWSTYIERIEQWFKVNKIEEANKASVLLVAIDEETYELFGDLCDPVKPSNKSYDQLVQIMKDHLEPSPSKRAERCKLRKRFQESGETLSQYLAALKNLAKTCQFGKELEDHITDQFLCGIKSENIRLQLMAEKDLDYKKAVRMALNLEAAEKDAHVFGEGNTSSPGTSSSTVNKLSARSRITGRGCRHCGKSNHDDRRCFFKSARCHRCGELGHVIRVCDKKGKCKPSEIIKKGKKRIVKTHNIQESNSDDLNHSFDQIDLHSSQEIFNISQTNVKPLKLNVKVNNTELCMEVDTGSAVSVIPEGEYYNHFKHIPLRRSFLKLRSYSGNSLEILGFIKVNVVIQGVCH